MKILETEDYSIFKRAKGNRTINLGQVKRLTESFIKSPQLINTNPILVNEKMEVIDGQHRLEALKIIGAKVAYVIKKDFGISEVQLLNSSTRIWTPIDYAKSYAEHGNQHYQTYLDFRLRHNLSHNTIYAYLSSSTYDIKDIYAFRAGKFKVRNEAMAEKICVQLKEVGKFYKYYQSRSFAIAFMRMFKNEAYDHDRMIAKLSKYARKHLHQAIYAEEYMRQLEGIYNKNVPLEDKVRFF